MVESLFFILTVAVFICLAVVAKQNGIKKDSDDWILAGVCAGIAKKFDIPPLAVRAAFVFSLLFFGVGIIPYIVLWAVLETAEEE